MENLENRNHLTCILTGKRRITNKSYLKKRTNKLGITEGEFRTYYVSESGRVLLKELLEEGRIGKAIYLLHGGLRTVPHLPTARDLYKVFQYNDKHPKFLEKLDSKYCLQWQARVTSILSSAAVVND